MWPDLNLAGHLTSLSGPTRAWNPPLHVGVTPLTRNRCGGLGVLSRMRLRSSMTLQRSSQLWSYSHILWLCVMRRRASFSARCRFGLAEDAASLQARLARSLWPADGSLQGPLADFSTTMRFAASVLCLARSAREEPSCVIRWMVSMIA
jgi:hypothetical protein